MGFPLPSPCDSVPRALRRANYAMLKKRGINKLATSVRDALNSIVSPTIYTTSDFLTHLLCDAQTPVPRTSITLCMAYYHTRIQMREANRFIVVMFTAVLGGIKKEPPHQIITTLRGAISKIPEAKGRRNTRARPTIVWAYWDDASIK